MWQILISCGKFLHTTVIYRKIDGCTHFCTPHTTVYTARPPSPCTPNHTILYTQSDMYMYTVEYTIIYTPYTNPSLFYTPLYTSSYTLSYTQLRTSYTIMYTAITHWCTHPRTPPRTIINIAHFCFFTSTLYQCNSKKCIFI